MKDANDMSEEEKKRVAEAFSQEVALDHYFEVTSQKAEHGNKGGDRVGKREVLFRSKSYMDAQRFWEEHPNQQGCYLDFCLAIPGRRHHWLSGKFP